MKSFYITTPIYYVNGKPHIGHSYTCILADMLTRYHALEGDEVFFLTGTDEHGDKIARSAEKEGVQPKELADRYAKDFKSLWDMLDVKYSEFIRTTDEHHKHVVQDVLQKIYDKGDIYFGEYGGYYCCGCERFYVENELENGVCPQHLTKPEYVKERNYFFKMSAYLPWLKEYITENPDFIQPAQYRNEVLALLEQETLDDLCISRPKSRLTWGIELPFDSDYVCYVWFDALLNYISGIGYPDSPHFTSFWAQAEHIIAKDILKPHAIFWPCMLRSAGLPIFKTLYVHGYWLAKDTKLSKSLGNVIDPALLIKQYGVDAIRYFLLRDMSFGSDANFSLTSLVSRITAELANDIGNLFSRTLGMLAKYCDSTVPQPAEYTHKDEDIQKTILEYIAMYKEHCRNVAPAKALECIVAIASCVNKYIDANAPWVLYKEKQEGRLYTVLYLVLEALRKITITLLPVVPSTAKTMLALLGITSPLGITLKNEEHTWGLLPVGNTLAPSANLFPRDQWEKPMDSIEKKTTKQAQSSISFDHFAQLDIRIGAIIHAKKVENAHSLLMLQVDIGEQETRTILSGIAERYSAEDMIGKRVLVVVNLEPKKIRGIDSFGMILTVEEGGTIHVLEPHIPYSNGSRIL